MKKIFLLSAFLTFGALTAQNTFPATGNVGIGTGSPANKLHVFSGTAGATGIRLGNVTASTVPTAAVNKFLGVNALGDVVYYNSNTLYSADGNLAGTRIVSMVNNALIFRPFNAGNDFYMNGTTGNVGLGTLTPSARLDVVGTAKANMAVLTSAYPTGPTYNFASAFDRNDKCTVLSAGTTIGTGTGYVNTRMLNFYDFPVSNLNAKAVVFFGIEDRSDAGRYRFIAETLGTTEMQILNKTQQEVMKVYEDGSDNVYMHFPKTNSRVVIGDLGTYAPGYKFVVRGSAKLEGDVIADANVGIGTSNFVDGTDTYKLAVNGNIRAKRVKVYTTWADYVFEKNYALPTLEEVEQHILDNGHLKDIPSAKEVEANGIELGEMNKKLLQKVEELTLYLIEMNKELQAVKSQLKKD